MPVEKKARALRPGVVLQRSAEALSLRAGSVPPPCGLILYPSRMGLTARLLCPSQFAKDAGAFFKMDDDNPLIRLDGLTKPLTVFIKKISDAIGGISKPGQIVRVARAEAEASEIQAKAKIKVSTLERRAMHRFLREEAKKQQNIEAIVGKALPLLEDKSAPQNMADDWITNLFDKSRIVSDVDMQQIWARVLAGEANSPGDFAKKTINLLADLDKSDAELFTNLLSFGWEFGEVVPLVFNLKDERYERSGINFGTLSHLESLGLIQFSNPEGYNLSRFPKVITAFYNERQVTLTFPQENDNVLDVGRVLLTRAGQQLATVCDATPVDGFYEFIYDRWASASLVPKRETEPSTSKIEGKHT